MTFKATRPDPAKLLEDFGERMKRFDAQDRELSGLVAESTALAEQINAIARDAEERQAPLRALWKALGVEITDAKKRLDQSRSEMVRRQLELLATVIEDMRG